MMAINFDSPTFWTDLQHEELHVANSSFPISSSLISELATLKPPADWLLPDLTIQCQKETLSVSSHLMGLVSEMFRRMINSGFKEQREKKVDVTNACSFETISTIVSFAYGHDFTVTETNWEELLTAIDHYHITKMEAHLPEKLSAFLANMTEKEIVEFAEWILEKAPNLVFTRKWICERAATLYGLMLEQRADASKRGIKSPIVSETAEQIHTLLTKHQIETRFDFTMTAISAHEVELLTPLNITSLNLSGCKRVTDTVGSLLARLPLYELDISDNSTITRHFLAPLAGIKSLKALSISRCPQIGFEGIVELIFFQLEKLDLSYNEWINNLCMIIAGILDGLRELNLNGCPNVTPYLLKNIALPTLKTLKIDALRFQSRSEILRITRLGALDHLEMGIANSHHSLLTDLPLRTLCMRNNTITTALSSSSTLRTLDLSGCTGRAEHLLPAMPLQSLFLRNTRFHNSPGDQIAAYTRLMELDLTRTKQIDDSVIEKLPTRLVSLKLASNSSLQDAGINRLAKLSRLRLLDISRCYQLDGSSFSVLSQLPLRQLKASHLTQLTTLAPLENCITLKELEIIECPLLPPETIQVLEKLPLTKVNLSKNPWVNDTGIALLDQSKTLQSLTYFDCSVTKRDDPADLRLPLHLTD